MRVGVTLSATASTSCAFRVPPAGLGGQRRAFRAACRATGGSHGHEAGEQGGEEVHGRGPRAWGQGLLSRPAALDERGRPAGV